MARPSTLDSHSIPTSLLDTIAQQKAHNKVEELLDVLQIRRRARLEVVEIEDLNSHQAIQIESQISFMKIYHRYQSLKTRIQEREFRQQINKLKEAVKTQMISKDLCLAEDWARASLELLVNQCLESQAITNQRYQDAFKTLITQLLREARSENYRLLTIIKIH